MCVLESLFSGGKRGGGLHPAVFFSSKRRFWGMYGVWNSTTWEQTKLTFRKFRYIETTTIFLHQKCVKSMSISKFEIKSRHFSPNFPPNSASPQTYLAGCRRRSLGSVLAVAAAAAVAAVLLLLLLPWPPPSSRRRHGGCR